MKKEGQLTDTTVAPYGMKVELENNNKSELGQGSKGAIAT